MKTDSTRTRVRIRLADTAGLDATTRAQVASVMGATFDVSGDPAAVIEPYFERMRQIFLAYDGARLVGFQFYQRRLIGARVVHHFSLAGRLPDARYRGVQARFGALLIRKALWTTPPWQALFLAGVTNNPRSYGNMLAVGGRCFPDITAPMLPNPFGDLYRRVGYELGVTTADGGCLVRDRMRSIGFGLVAMPASDHPLEHAYDAFVEGDRRNGVLVLVEIVPSRDLPRYLWSRWRRSRSVALPQVPSSAGAVR